MTLWSHVAQTAGALCVLLVASLPLPSSIHQDVADHWQLTPRTEPLQNPAPPAPELIPMPDGTPAPIQARADLVKDLGSHLTLASRNENQRLPMASLTKLMTVTITLEHTDPQEIVDVKSEDLITDPEESHMGLAAGDRVTVGQLIYGLLIPSGNDAAMALARYVGKGSVKSFVSMMNEKAAALGLADTHYDNPVGLDSPGQYTSARDLSVLAEYALRESIVRDIVGMRTYTAHAVNGKAYPLFNTNRLLGGTVVGVKTGHTDAAGDCLIALDTANGHEIMSVVLNSPDRFSETRALLDWEKTHVTW